MRYNNQYKIFLILSDGDIMSKLIGIDLGTTNSCVAVMEHGESVIIPNESGDRTTPSVVAFTKDGERLIGKAAKHQAVINPSRTISSIKRDMGSNKKIEIDSKKYTPPEISAMILSRLKADAESYLEEKVYDAVITVPAYFTDSQRQATKDAGTIAGLNVKRIINEPTAAALAYGVDKEEAQKILVYDLGGGTFDVSILDINGGVIEVMATAGNNRLGGDDFDNILTDYITDEFKNQSGCDAKKDITALSRIKEAAEKAKIELSSTTQTEINLPFLMQKKDGPAHLEMTITRAKFNSLTSHLVEATMGPVHQALSDAGLIPANISKVLMVGGSSRIPAVQEAVRNFIGKEPFKGINPDECVAIGAALQGGVLSGEITGLLLLDVTPLSLGIETAGGIFSKIIDRNTTLPIKKSEIYTTAVNFQTSVDVKVFQGERQMTADNKLLGEFHLNGIKRAMRGIPQIEVTFEIDANGIVHVTAKDMGTGKSQDITITASSNLNREEIDRAVKEAQIYAEEDKRKKTEANAENEIEQLMFRASNIMKKLNKEDKKRLDEACKKVNKLKKSKNTEEKAAAVTELERIVSQMESTILTSEQNGENTNGSSNNSKQNEDQSENEYYDADFKD